MEKVATILRFMQLYAHVAHNLAFGKTFFQDHAFFGELYPAYEAAYDSVVERMIGLDKKPDLSKIHSSAVDVLKKTEITTNESAIKTLLKIEKELCACIENEVLPEPMMHPHGGKDPLSQGSVQLLGDIANASEMRQYKMKQRLK